ncbi:MAG: MAC/perforin domain-containing protein, partial [Bacteroidota bacterium]
MSNMIPGATSVLGWGFNIFGEYSEKSKLRQLLDFSKAGSRQETVNGVSYEIPNGVSAGSSHNFSGSATFLSNKEEITNYFSVKAGVSGGYAGFKGSLKVGFSRDELNSSEFNYAIYDGQKLAYPLTVNNPSSNLLAEAVLADPDYQQMMQAAGQGFDRNNPAPFYRFFLKYGTHFVKQVDMGGSLYYYAAVNKSFTSRSDEVTVKASFEYNGLFNVKAEAEVDWKKVGKEWVDNRQMKLVVVGGDVNFPTTADASFGTNMNEQYNKWITAVDSNPAPMGFQLSTIDKLFSGQEAAVIAEALRYFIASEVFIQVERSGISMAVNGVPVDTSAYQGVLNNNGKVAYFFDYLAIVIDRKSGQVVDQAEVRGPGYLNYNLMQWKGEIAPSSKDIPPNLQKYAGNNRYVLA